MDFREGGMLLGTKKAYRKPSLQTFGDIRRITRINKDFGGGDAGILFLSQTTCDLNTPGDCS